MSPAEDLYTIEIFNHFHVIAATMLDMYLDNAGSLFHVQANNETVL